MALATVKACEQKETKGGKTYWRVQFAPGGWASTFSATIGRLCEKSKDEKVEVELENNGDFTNIKAVSAVKASSAASGGKDDRIVREVALKAAVEIAIASQRMDAGWIFAIAGAFVDWINGEESDPPEPDEIPL